jgi:hypothetical protein
MCDLRIVSTPGWGSSRVPSLLELAGPAGNSPLSLEQLIDFGLRNIEASVSNTVCMDNA